MALKNFSLRKPSLTEEIFITQRYIAHFPDIEMQPLNMLQLARTILTNVSSASLQLLPEMVSALQKEFCTNFQLFLDTGVECNAEYCREWVKVMINFLQERVDAQSELVCYLVRVTDVSLLAQILDHHPVKDV